MCSLHNFCRISNINTAGLGARSRRTGQVTRGGRAAGWWKVGLHFLHGNSFPNSGWKSETWHLIRVASGGVSRDYLRSIYISTDLAGWGNVAPGPGLTWPRPRHWTQTEIADTILYFLTYTYWHIGILTSSEVAIITRSERHSIIFKIFEIVARTDRCNPVDTNEDE